MKKCLIKITIIAITIIMSIIVIYCLFTNRNIFNIGNSRLNKNAKEDNEINYTLENNIGNSEDKEVYENGENVIIGDYVFKVNSTRKTKERGNFSINNKWSSIFEFDDYGNLIDDNSYLIVNLTIENTSSETKEIYLNNYRVELFGEDESIALDSLECISASKTNESVDKDYFKVELKPYEECNYDIIFPGKDDFFKYNNMRLKIRVYEMNIDKPRYIKIKY